MITGKYFVVLNDDAVLKARVIDAAYDAGFKNFPKDDTVGMFRIDFDRRTSGYTMVVAGFYQKDYTLVSVGRLIDLLNQFKKEKEKTIIVGGKEYSESTIKAALRAYVGD